MEAGFALVIFHFKKATLQGVSDPGKPRTETPVSYSLCGVVCGWLLSGRCTEMKVEIKGKCKPPPAWELTGERPPLAALRSPKSWSHFRHGVIFDGLLNHHLHLFLPESPEAMGAYKNGFGGGCEGNARNFHTEH